MLSHNFLNEYFSCNNLSYIDVVCFRLSTPQDGDVICDPMCGSSAIAIEVGSDSKCNLVWTVDATENENIYIILTGIEYDTRKYCTR